jgi:radical SAM modification target selenobiotic family peptide
MEVKRPFHGEVEMDAKELKKILAGLGIAGLIGGSVVFMSGRAVGSG